MEHSLVTLLPIFENIKASLKARYFDDLILQCGKKKATDFWGVKGQREIWLADIKKTHHRTPQYHIHELHTWQSDDKALCIQAIKMANKTHHVLQCNRNGLWICKHKGMLWKISSPGFSCTLKAAQLLNKSTERTRVSPINSYKWKEEDWRCSFWSLSPHFWQFGLRSHFAAPL